MRNGRRGRPKGTGLDDSIIIAAVVDRMKHYEECRTRAIKSCGIQSPSAVRRIRDKIRREGHETDMARHGARHHSKAEWTERDVKRLTALFHEGARIPRMQQVLVGYSAPRIQAKLKELGLEFSQKTRSGFAERTYGN